MTIAGVKRHVDKLASLVRDFDKAQSAGVSERDSANIAAPAAEFSSAAENESLELAKKLRAAEVVSDAQRDQLMRLVSQSLDARLEKQQLLAEQLATRLATIQANLQSREASRQRIIERRVARSEY